MDPEFLIPIVLFIAMAYVIVQFLDHRERMKMIEKGVTRLELRRDKQFRDNSVKYGVIAIALGSAILIAQIFEQFLHLPLGGEIGLALVPIFVGVALVIYAKIGPKNGQQSHVKSEHIEMRTGE